MQNKANFRNDKMNENLFATKDYENETAFRPQKYKPKQSQSQKQKPEDRSQKTEFGPLSSFLRPLFGARAH